MSAVVKIKPSHPAHQKTSATRRCSLNECRVEPPPIQDIEDRLLHAQMAKLTGGISPMSLALAGFDWVGHLMLSPSKRKRLAQSLLEKTASMSMYALQAASGQEIEPVVTPPSSDHRFPSDGWKRWPFNVIEQNFLLTQQWWDEATSDMRGVSKHHLDVVSFTARQMLDMASPSNSPFTNPDILQTTIDEGGRNFVRGVQNWLDDTKRSLNDKPPAGLDAFKVGEDVAVTPGKVVYRNSLIELIQYTPTTKEVCAEPVLITPAWIMKYYILDLSPYNSLVKYLVDKGHTVFMISWKNPDAEDRDVGLEDYLHTGLGEAIKAVKAITNAPQLNAMGYCLGGTLLSIMAAALARDGDETFKTVTLLASQVDFEEAGEIMIFTDESQVAYLEDGMWDKGYLDKKQMAGAFELLRSNDLIWSRIINDYMQGKRRAAFDMLAWNADATRMPYRMHSEYLRELFLQNDLAEGRFMVNSAPVALQDIRTPIFSVGTSRDHVAPWKSVYKIMLLTESDITFVLTSGGHNAGIVSEPGHKGREYQIAKMPGSSRYIPPGQWQKTTAMKQGSWWEDWNLWLTQHSEGKIKPPVTGNTKDYKPIADAPGSYVFMK
jgi:polyhydroxyalkanoate synthase